MCCALSIVSDGGGGRGTTPGRRRRVYDGDVEVVGSRPMGGEAHPRKSQCLLLSPSCPPTSLDRFFHLRQLLQLGQVEISAGAPFAPLLRFALIRQFSLENIARSRRGENLSFAYFTNYALLVRNTLRNNSRIFFFTKIRRYHLPIIFAVNLLLVY